VRTHEPAGAVTRFTGDLRAFAAPSVLDRLLLGESLWSDLARRQFLIPDLAPLPAGTPAPPSPPDVASTR
jgi:hypothetical protein